MLFSDLIDQIARILLLIGGSGILILLGWDAWRWLRDAPTFDDEADMDDMDETINRVDEAEEFMRRVERLSRKEIDKNDDRNRKG
jgi:hypothetical protein